MILLNAEGMILGRLASFAAKNALRNEQVVIVNAEKAFITGGKEDAMKKLKKRRDLQYKGNPRKGPKYSRMPDRVLRMAVRGMLPFKSSRGREAYRRVKVFISVPREFEGKEFSEAKGAAGRSGQKHVELGTVCSLLGAKW